MTRTASSFLALLVPPEFRFRLETWAARSVSASCCGDVAAVDVLFGLDRELTPLRMLFELRPLLTLAVSDGPSESSSSESSSL